MSDALKRLYGFPGPTEPPTEEECQEAAEAFLPLVADGYWTPPQTATPTPPAPEES